MLTSIEIINWILLSFLAVSVVSVAFIENVLINMLGMCLLGFVISVLYLVMNAPDVAITEAAVGTGFGMAIMLAVFSHLNCVRELYAKGARGLWRECDRLKLLGASAVSVLLFLVVSYGVVDLPKFGDAASPANVAATSSYINNAYGYTGIPNLVTAILASFRGYDTLCETVVVFTAAMCVSLLIGRGHKKT